MPAALRRSLPVVVAVLVLAVAAVPRPAYPEAGAQPAPIRLWPNGAPGSDAAHWPTPSYHEEWEVPGQVLRGVTDPSIQVYLPPAAINTGAAVVVCPGGAYRNLWIEKEGWKVAEELRTRGVAAIVLKYRHYDPLAAVQDAHRAIRMVRARAAEWHINPKAVGIGGFSAGGHLALNTAGQLGRPEGWPPDAIDAQSKRPDFVMAIYPAVELPGATVDGTFPPVFLAVASDDERIHAGDILPFMGRLRALKVPIELHMYLGGGHGFGTGTPECRCASWLDLFRTWLEARGLVSKAPGRP